MFSLGYWAIYRFQPCTCTHPRSCSSVPCFAWHFSLKTCSAWHRGFLSEAFTKNLSVQISDSLLITDFHHNKTLLLLAVGSDLISAALEDRTIKLRLSDINIYSTHLCLTGHKVDKVRLTLQRQRMPARSGLDRANMTPMFKNTLNLLHFWDLIFQRPILWRRDILLWAISRVYPL